MSPKKRSRWYKIGIKIIEGRTLLLFWRNFSLLQSETSEKFWTSCYFSTRFSTIRFSSDSKIGPDDIMVMSSDLFWTLWMWILTDWKQKSSYKTQDVHLSLAWPPADYRWWFQSQGCVFWGNRRLFCADRSWTRQLLLHQTRPWFSKTPRRCKHHIGRHRKSFFHLWVLTAPHSDTSAAPSSLFSWLFFLGIYHSVTTQHKCYESPSWKFLRQVNKRWRSRWRKRREIGGIGADSREGAELYEESEAFLAELPPKRWSTFPQD